jgi:hypothetical protein
MLTLPRCLKDVLLAGRDWNSNQRVNPTFILALQERNCARGYSYGHAAAAAMVCHARNGHRFAHWHAIVRLSLAIECRGTPVTTFAFALILFTLFKLR